MSLVNGGDFYVGRIHIAYTGVLSLDSHANWLNTAMSHKVQF